MADRMTIDADASSLIAALTRLPEVMAARCKAVAKVTADRIVVEARARVRRRTGVTAMSIHAEEAHSGDGWVVLPWDANFARQLLDSGNNDDVINFSLPGWIEFGTQTMSARPFLFNSARMEEGAHMRRLGEAAQQALDEIGLGD